MCRFSNIKWSSFLYRSVKIPHANFEQIKYTYINKGTEIVITYLYPEWMNRINMVN